MFARITRFKLKPGAREAATQQVEDMKADIMALPGMQEFINVTDDDGNGYVISLVESREMSDANADSVREIWGRMANHLEAMPVPEGFDIAMHWRA